MKRLSWTTEKPTQTGWYFWRLRKGGVAITERVERIEDRMHSTGIQFYVESFTNDPSEPVKEIGGEWAGPIEPPEDIS